MSCPGRRPYSGSDSTVCTGKRGIAYGQPLFGNHGFPVERTRSFAFHSNTSRRAVSGASESGRAIDEFRISSKKGSASGRALFLSVWLESIFQGQPFLLGKVRSQILHVVVGQGLRLTAHDGVLAYADLVFMLGLEEIIAVLSGQPGDARHGAVAVRAVAGCAGGGFGLAGLVVTGGMRRERGGQCGRCEDEQRCFHVSLLSWPDRCTTIRNRPRDLPCPARTGCWRCSSCQDGYVRHPCRLKTPPQKIPRAARRAW